MFLYGMEHSKTVHGLLCISQCKGTNPKEARAMTKKVVTFCELSSEVIVRCVNTGHKETPLNVR